MTTPTAAQPISSATGRAIDITTPAPSFPPPKPQRPQAQTPPLQADPTTKSKELTEAIQGNQSLSTVKQTLQQWHNAHQHNCPFHPNSHTHNFLQCSTTYGICRDTNNFNALKQCRLDNNVVVIPRQPQQNPTTRTHAAAAPVANI
jgi:hypothetical protein